MKKDPNFGDKWFMFNNGHSDIFGVEYQEIYNLKMFSTAMVASSGETLRWIEDQITLGHIPTISDIDERAKEYLREKEIIDTYITPVMYGTIIWGQLASKTQFKNEGTRNTQVT